jgi:single-strand DNA-binding protein
MTVNLNQIAITGNLVGDPSLVTLASGHVLCEMRLASHHRARDEITGAWQEWADYFTVKAFGFQARTSYQGLSKGSGVAVSGRLSSRRVTGRAPAGAHPRGQVVGAELGLDRLDSR